MTALLCAVLTGALGLAAAPATSEAAVAAAAEDAPADWTMMIYDVADNNIAEIMVRNLAQFPAIANMDNVNIVALVDLPEKNERYYPSATLPGIAPFSTAKLMLLKDGKWNEIRDEGEVAMGRPDVLAGFIEEVADRFPADKYGLVLSDHGGAYGGGYVDEGAPGQSRLRVADIRDGISTGMQRAGIDQFEVIDHDACLMASYEATSALAPLAKWIVGSEEVTFGTTTLSPQAMQMLGDDISGEQWGIANNEDYAAYADSDPYGDGGGAFTALSVMDTSQAARLDHAVDNFVDVVVPQMDELAPTLAQARSKALGFVAGLENGDDLGYNLVDLGDFMRQLGNDLPADVAVARDAVFAALDATVTAQVTRQATQQATGMNVFFPKSPESAQSYLDEELGTPSWNRLVGAYVDAVQGGGGDTTGGGGDGVAQFLSEQADVLDLGPGGIRISGQLAPGDIEDVADAETQVFARLDGKDTLVSILPATLNSGGEGQVQGVWNFAVTALASGDVRSPVSAIYQSQSGGIVGVFKARYAAPDGFEADVLFRVLLDSSGQIQSFSVVDAEQGDAAGPITLEEGGTLTPYLITVSSDGTGQFELSSTSVPAGADLDVRYPKLPAGTPFDMSLVVSDISGGTTFAGVNETTQ
jgi:hypothetical protein